MELPSTLAKERAVRDFLGEGVLEDELRLRKDARLVDQLERDEVSQQCLDPRARLHDTVQEAAAEPATDRRGGLERPLRPLGEAIDARRNHVLDRVGHDEIVEWLGERPALVAPLDGPGLLKRLDQLLDEERVAFGLARDESQQALGEALRGQHGPSHRHGIARRQRVGADASVIAAIAERM
jgi:hypothetical protein